MPKKRSEQEGYGAYREGQAAISRKRSAEGREIGPLPPVGNPERRNSCIASLRTYCETYRKETFKLAWSDDHLKAIAKLEAAVISGGLFALAMPRGSGKTSLCEAAAEWAILCGHRRFVAIIGATETAAEEMLESIKLEMETNELLLEDFPEVCHPVVMLEGQNNRANGQTLGGERTRITWSNSEIVFPTVRGAASSGARIRVAGITGRVRGMKAKDATGATIRPDFAIADDPQTDESAGSPLQTARRERVLMGAVKGLAGPGKTIAFAVPCTVIAKNDLADRILDRDRHPHFQGERFRTLYSLPTNLDLWDKYTELRRESLRNDGNGAEATAFYRSNREAMDAGAVVAWPARFDPENEDTALQAAMNQRADNPDAFAAEGQNQPIEHDGVFGAKEIDPRQVEGRLNGHERYAVPPGCTRVTAFIDLGGGVHWYAVCAWNEYFGGAVLDYGTWPRQSRQVFAANDVRPSLKDLFPAHTEEQRVYAGLEGLVPEIMGRTHHGPGKGEFKVERLIIDAGKWPDAVYRFVQKSAYGGAIYPSKGVARSDTSAGVAKWKSRPGERSGHHWRLTQGVTSGRGRQVQFDPDAWKTLLHSALIVPPGGNHGVFLWGKSASVHAMLAEHCAAETSEPKTTRLGDTFDKWIQRPHRPDNHLWDCLVGCAVGASVQGLTFQADGSVSQPAQAKQRVKLSDELARKRAQRGG